MKIYDFEHAPNPKKLRVYLAEKGIEVELAPVNIAAGETRNDAFRARNPMMGVPVLELDDGRCFNESLAIIQYFEELHPEPPMIGATAEERLRVRALERTIELGVMMRVVDAVWHSHPFFSQRVTQTPSMVNDAMRTLHGTLKVLDGVIGEQPFVAGAQPTIGDITLYTALWFARMMDVTVDLAKRPNVGRWYEAFKARPSAKA